MFLRRGTQPTARASISCRKAFGWDYERFGVGAEVEKYLCEDVVRAEGDLVKSAVSEADGQEDDCKDSEAPDSDESSAGSVRDQSTKEVSWHSAGADENMQYPQNLIEEYLPLCGVTHL